MSNHDYNIANADGATVRADINAALEAVVTNNSGSLPPPTTFPHMWWYDTSSSPAILKRRNAANTAWLDFVSEAEITTSTGTQTLEDALDSRVLYADRVSGLSSFSVVEVGARVIVQGSEFRWDGAAWQNLSRRWTPKMYEDLVNDVPATPDWSPAFVQMVADASSGDDIDGQGASYHLATPVDVNKRLRFIGGGTVSYDTLAITGGALSFVNGSGGSFIGGGKWAFQGPETRTSWEASDKAVLHSAVYFEASPDSSVSKFEGSGSRIPLSVVDCDRFRLDGFNVVGFLPDVDPPSTGGGALVPPYTPGINWAEGMRIIESNDVRISNARGDHHGNVVTLGGTCERPVIRNVTGQHMHDNGVYVSSSNYADVAHVYFEDCRGSCAKVRGSHSRVKDVSGLRCAIGVTVSPLPLSGAIVPANQQVDTDAVVEAVYLEDGFIAALADSVNIDGTEVALSNVTFKGIRAKTMRGIATLGCIRMTVAGENATITDFDIDSCPADWPVQIGGISATEAYWIYNAEISNGTVSGANAIGRIFNAQGWEMKDISSHNMTAPASTVVVEPRSASDGYIHRINNNDSSLRIDATHVNNSRTSIIDCRAFVFDGPQIENYGNATTSLKNISTTAPFKAGQMCLTSAAGVAISKGAGSTADWVALP